jgi:GTP-binding protein Era
VRRQIWAEYDEARGGWVEGYRSGFASFVGRPNAGKSTLTNALVGRRS